MLSLIITETRWNPLEPSVTAVIGNFEFNRGGLNIDENQITGDVADTPAPRPHVYVWFHNTQNMSFDPRPNDPRITYDFVNEDDFEKSEDEQESYVVTDDDLEVLSGS